MDLKTVNKLDIAPLQALLNIIKDNYFEKPEVFRTLIALLYDYDPTADSKCKVIKYVQLLLTDHPDVTGYLLSLLPLYKPKTTGKDEDVNNCFGTSSNSNISMWVAPTAVPWDSTSNLCKPTAAGTYQILSPLVSTNTIYNKSTMTLIPVTPMQVGYCIPSPPEQCGGECAKTTTPTNFLKPKIEQQNSKQDEKHEDLNKVKIEVSSKQEVALSQTMSDTPKAPNVPTVSSESLSNTPAAFVPLTYFLQSSKSQPIITKNIQSFSFQNVTRFPDVQICQRELDKNKVKVNLEKNLDKNPVLKSKDSKSYIPTTYQKVIMIKPKSACKKPNFPSLRYANNNSLSPNQPKHGAWKQLSDSSNSRSSSSSGGSCSDGGLQTKTTASEKQKNLDVSSPKKSKWDNGRDSAQSQKESLSNTQHESLPTNTTAGKLKTKVRERKNIKKV